MDVAAYTSSTRFEERAAYEDVKTALSALPGVVGGVVESTSTPEESTCDATRARLEYLQAHTGLKKRVQEQVVDDIRRTNVSKFQVTGEEYHKSGRVTAWRVSVLRGTEELVSQQSALWN